jgi:chorismate mutase
MTFAGAVRAIHLSTTAQTNSPGEIERAVREMLQHWIASDAESGGVEVISALLAGGPGLDAAFPAAAARRWGIDAAVMSLQLSSDAPPLRIEALLHVRASRPAGASHTTPYVTATTRSESP